MASKANKIRRAREARGRVKAANKRRLELIRKGEIVLSPRHGKSPKRPRMTWGSVMAKWWARVRGKPIEAKKAS